MNARPRIAYLDVIRVLACFLVIVNHTAGIILLDAFPSGAWWASDFMFFLSKAAVPLFLMVTGAVLLGRQDGIKRSLLRAVRVLAAALVFSFVYFVKRRVFDGEPFDIPGFFRTVWGGNITDSFWYLYFYAALMVMMPILQKLSSALTKKDTAYFLAVSLVFLGTAPIVTGLFPALRYNSAFSLPLFSTYLGLVLLGRCIHESFEPRAGHCALAALVLLACVAAASLCTYREYTVSPGVYPFFDNRLFITATAPAAAVFVIVKYLRARGKKGGESGRLLALCGRCAFGAYLLSPCFIELLRPVYDALSGAITRPGALIVYELCVFLAGLSVTAALRCVPILKKIL